MTMEMSPILISLKTAGISIVIVFFLGIIVADAVMKISSKKWQMAIDTFFTLTLVLPPTVIGFILLVLLGNRGLVGTWFNKHFQIKFVFNWISTVIAASVISFPLMYRSARGAFEQLDEQMIAAARTLGLSERIIFWKIKIPNAMPGLLAGGVLAFARGLGEYGATSMLAGNILGKTRTLPIAVATESAAGNYAQSSYYVTILVAISILLLVGLQWILEFHYKRGRRL